MSTERDVTGIVRTWLEVGATALPDRVLDNVLDRLPATPQRRPWWPTRRFRHMTTPVRLALAAAAIGIVAVVGVSVQPRSSSIGGPTIEASPSPLPTPSPTPARLPDGPLSAGTYVVTPFAASGSDLCWEPPQPGCSETLPDDDIRFTFTVPDGWDGIRDVGVGLTDTWIDGPTGAEIIFVRGAWPYDDPCQNRATAQIPVGPTAADFADALDAHPLLDVTTPVDITLAGYSGKYVDLQVPLDLTDCEPYRPWEPWYYAQGPGERWHLSILDVGGLRVVIQAMDHQGTTAEVKAQLQGIVDSIEIEHPPLPMLSPSPVASVAPDSELSLQPPTDVDAYVTSAYEGLVDLPALSITLVEQEGTKARYMYNGAGIVHHDHFENATNSEPSEFRIFSRDVMAERSELDGQPIWLQNTGQGHPLSELAGAAGVQTYCETAWEYVGLEYLIDRPTHHVSCGESEMWLDVETRLPLRSVRVQPDGLARRVDVTELQVGSQPAELFVPPAGLRVMTTAEYECASDPACQSPAPEPTGRPVITPAPAPAELAAPADLDAFVAEVLATYPTLPALEMIVGSDDSRTRYLSDGSGRYRMEGGSEPSAMQVPTFLYTGGHSYESFKQDDGHVIWQDQGPDVYLGIPDLDVSQGCRTRWEHRGFDLVLDRPAHHLVCGYDEYWIDSDSLLVVRHQRNPDPLHYDTNVDEVTELRFVQPPAELFELPADADVRDVACPSFIPGRRGCEPRPSGAAIGTGPALTWTKVGLDATAVAWLGDRFILADEDAHTVSTSTDGRTWESIATTEQDRAYYDLLTQSVMNAGWQDNMVGWDPNASGSGVVRVVHPPAAPVTKTDFQGMVATVGIGPAGIVARVHSGIDFDAFVTTFLGPDWVGHMTEFDFQDGVLHIATTDGRSTDIVMADHGLGPGDVADRGYGWYSADGASWTVIADFPSNTSDVVGISNGFIARAESMWYSPDGMTWREIGDYTEGLMVPWGDGVLMPGSDGLELWTADGGRTLPMAVELPPGSLPSHRVFGAGSLGLVSIGTTDVLYAPNGTDWSISAMPDPMYASGGARRAPTIAVGDHSVVVLMWSGGESPVPSLWVGTPES